MIVEFKINKEILLGIAELMGMFHEIAYIIVKYDNFIVFVLDPSISEERKDEFEDRIIIMNSNIQSSTNENEKCYFDYKFKGCKYQD